MKKALAIAGILALSTIPTPSFSGEVEQKEMMSVTEQLLPQICDKNLDIKEKKAYKEALINYLEDVQKTEATGVGEAFCGITDWNCDRSREMERRRRFRRCAEMHPRDMNAECSRIMGWE